MYGYKEFIPLTAEEILKRVSEKDVFGIIIKKPIIIDKTGATYVAPYRNDNNPDCYFDEYQGRIYFVDFADIDKRPKNCMKFLMRSLSLDYKNILEYINEYFNLGLGNSTKVAKKIIVENSYNVEDFSKVFKKKRTITYIPRQFNGKDNAFWRKYEISKQNLIDDGVIPIDLYKSTNRKGEPFTVRPLDIMYAYTDFNEGKIKIYAPRGNKLEKWFTNCNQDDIGSMKHLPDKGELLIISKSYKDCRVIRNQWLNSVWFQNEGMLPNLTIIKNLCKRFKTIVVWFDNDQAGLANGKVVVDYINSIVPKKAKLIFLPPKLLQEKVKDPSDFIAVKGKQELIKFLQEKKLIVI
jgi:hypothetical protein